MKKTYEGNETRSEHSIVSGVNRYKIFFYQKGIIILVLLGCLLLFFGCGKVKNLETELVRVREEHASEVSEINHLKEIEVQESYKKGRKAGFIESLDEAEESIFLRGKTEGYQEGVAEGEEKIKEFREKQGNIFGEVTSLETKLEDAENNLKALQDRLDAVLEERADLMVKLRAAIDRVDLYEMETKGRKE